MYPQVMFDQFLLLLEGQDLGLSSCEALHDLLKSEKSLVQSLHG